MGKYASRLIAIAIAAYFLYFAIPALRAHFAVDDPMNLGLYWRIGFWRSVWNTLCFWNTAYRPMGALFYLPIYRLFGLNPLPYRVVIVAILAANVFLSYRIGATLTHSQAAATLTAILVCAHLAIPAIYYNTALVYDVLAFFFTALMLFVYMRARRDGHPLGLGQSAAVIACFIAAIDSKEIAIVGAAWVLAYEMLFFRPWRLRVPLILSAVALIVTVRRALGPGSLSTLAGYRVELTWHRFFVNNRAYASDIFYADVLDKTRNLLIAWALLTLLCAVARKRELWWTWFMASTATLPLAFLVRPRHGPSLYLPLLAFALLASACATIFFKKVPAVQWAAVGLVLLLFVPHTLRYWNDGTKALLKDQELTWSVLTQLRDLGSRPPPHSTVLFLNDPFQAWDTYFIATLLWNDPTIDVKLADKLGEPPNLKDYDWVLTFEDNKLRVVRSR